ncbi:YdcH family protein [Tateyamaria armeniaca]|uniref:YdcH family protein n=1 Tax=Tateyamaria armeniaca TaxID=2518930 RepID=A0ABW8UYT2_9RHOB
MTHTPHELTSDFPEYADKISELRQADAHFARLADAYHDINRDVHRAETDIEPTSDEHLTEMRRTRMRLKDEIFGMLKG